MITKEIIEKLLIAIKIFFVNDKSLPGFNNNMTNMINERTISFRLGIYLQQLFSNYDVDCEYNRYVNDVKIYKEEKVYPDTIIHKRGNNENNLVWIEYKKINYKDGEGIESDKEKVRHVTKKNNEFHYQLGFFIVIAETFDETKITIYENGNEGKEYNLKKLAMEYNI